MKNAICAAALLLCTLSAWAKDKPMPLSADAATQLRDKRIALTVHDKPDFIAMTAGKASFALFGAAAMASAGNQLVKENDIPDPAVELRQSLTNLLASTYGATFLPVDMQTVDTKRPAELAALHRDADYVLDVRSGGWQYGYFPTQWSEYWIGYSVQVQLVETATGKPVSTLACNANTQKDSPRPSREALHADGARLLKHALASLGARCVQLLAREQFRIPDASIPALTAELSEPLQLPGGATPAGTDASAADAEGTAAPAAQSDGTLPKADAPASTSAPAASPISH